MYMMMVSHYNWHMEIDIINNLILIIHIQLHNQYMLLMYQSKLRKELNK